MSAESAFNLRQEFDGVDADDKFSEPVGYGVFGDFVLVGQNPFATNANCGGFSRWFGCVHTELHGVTLGGKNFSGKVYVKPVFHSCDSPLCPVCFYKGWAGREAHKIEVRLAEGAKRFGLVEHIVATVPPKFYGLDYEALRAKVVQILSDRGVIGGVLIFHGARFNLRQCWYWSPHFHCLGFIRGGYGKCRGCAKCVKGCGGFVDRSYRCFEKDSCVVKVLAKRKTVGGTAWYQLNHSTVKVGAKRFHVATWFGVCSYRKLKVMVTDKKSVCPICGSDLVKLLYFGDKRFDLGKREFYDDAFDADGRPVWLVDMRSGVWNRE